MNPVDKRARIINTIALLAVLLGIVAYFAPTLAAVELQLGIK